VARHVVARAADVPDGSSRVVTVRGRELAVFNLGGEFFALINRCPHEGGPLGLGLRVGLSESDRPGHYAHSRPGELLRCPWHGWEFDIRTGQSWCDPARLKAKRYAAGREPGAAVVKGPYVAESFPVSVEEDYVVVEV
jgi:3-phenylpropionate/trans-cinnamate dioxygenase ferredoxin subunit